MFDQYSQKLNFSDNFTCTLPNTKFNKDTISNFGDET